MREKFKKLFKDSGLLFISSFSSKILVFLLVPLYTNILSTREYGIYDLFYSTIQMITPILTLNIIDSVFRFAIDKNNNKKSIFTIGIKYSLISIIIVDVLSLIVGVLNIGGIYGQYLVFFTILYIVYIIHDFFIQFVRGLDRVKDISLSGIVSTIVMILSNVLFLIVFKMGLVGYFYAMIISLLVPSGLLFFKNKLWEYIDFREKELELDQYKKQMIKYSLPLIFISLSWHINSVADRYVVTFISGIEENGIYSISYKIPAILNAIQVIFIQAWQISAIKEFKRDEDPVFYNLTYKGCNILMTTLCSILIASSKIIAKVLFAKEFYVAWKYVPILLIYIVFNTLSGTVGAVFSAAKETKKLAISGVIGALTNIVLNFVLVYEYGAMGAAIATLISSVVIWMLRVYYSKKYNISIDLKKDVYMYVILLIQSILLINVKSELYSYILQFIILLFVIVINYLKLKKLKKDIRGINNE